MRTASRSCITGTYYVRHRLIWDAQVGAFGPGAAPPHDENLRRRIGRDTGGLVGPRVPTTAAGGMVSVTSSTPAASGAGAGIERRHVTAARAAAIAAQVPAEAGQPGLAPTSRLYRRKQGFGFRVLWSRLPWPPRGFPTRLGHLAVAGSDRLGLGGGAAALGHGLGSGVAAGASRPLQGSTKSGARNTQPSLPSGPSRPGKATAVARGAGFPLTRPCNAQRCALLSSGVRFAHRGLRRFYARGDARGLNPDQVARIRRLLTALQDASSPQDMALPGWRLHPLTGERRGQWGVRVSGNWRIVFRFVDGAAVDVDLIDYH